MLALQFAPPSVLLNTPPPSVPAKRVLEVEGSMARARTWVLVRPMTLQVSPPSVLLNTPVPVPAKTVPAFKESMARA